MMVGMKESKYYEVRIECQLPATLTYRVYAESAEEAYEMAKRVQPNGVQYKLAGRREIKVSVYELGSSIIKFMKNLVGVIR